MVAGARVQGGCLGALDAQRVGWVQGGCRAGAGTAHRMTQYAALSREEVPENLAMMFITFPAAKDPTYEQRHPGTECVCRAPVPPVPPCPALQLWATQLCGFRGCHLLGCHWHQGPLRWGGAVTSRAPPAWQVGPA